MKIIHHFDNGGKVVADAPEHVTPEDAEKLFIAVYFAKDSKDFSYNGIEVTGATVHIADVKRMCNAHDDSYIIEALTRVAKLVITYASPGQAVVTHLLHEVRFDMSTGVITLLFNALFYRACRLKALTISLDNYIALSPTAKNLYAFIASNSAAVYGEELLIERCVIITAGKLDARKQLKKALEELNTQKIIRAYECVKKEKQRYFIIHRHGN